MASNHSAHLCINIFDDTEFDQINYVFWSFIQLNYLSNKCGGVCMCVICEVDYLTPFYLVTCYLNVLNKYVYSITFCFIFQCHSIRFIYFNNQQNTTQNYNYVHNIHHPLPHRIQTLYIISKI